MNAPIPNALRSKPNPPTDHRSGPIMKAVAYARTSWAEQLHDSHPSVEEQHRRILEFAQQSGITITHLLEDRGLDVDKGTSSGIVELLDQKVKPWLAVVVTSEDRLITCPPVSLDARPELALLEKGFWVVGKESAANAKQRAGLLDIFLAKEERQRAGLLARLFQGRQQGALEGFHQSGPTPFGYARDHSRKLHSGVMLVPDEDQARSVRLIFTEYLRLGNVKALVASLNGSGQRTRRGKLWSRAGINWILRNETYLGRVHFGGIRSEGKHEPLISHATFALVQTLLRKNRRNPAGAKGKK